MVTIASTGRQRRLYPPLGRAVLLSSAALLIVIVGKFNISSFRQIAAANHSRNHHKSSPQQINEARTTKFAVMGGTGMQGGAAIDLLLESGISPLNVRTITRNASSPAAKRLSEKKGIEVMEGSQDIGSEEDSDYSQKVEELKAAYSKLFHGAECIFALTFTQYDDETREKRLGRILFESIAASPSVKLVVFSGGERTGIHLLDAKADIEEIGRTILKGTGIKCVFLHSSFFMENLLIKGKHKRYRLLSSNHYELSLPLPIDRRIAMISARDIGNIAAQILLNGIVEDNGQQFDSFQIVGDIVSPQSFLQNIKASHSLSGLEFDYRQTHFDELKAAMGEAQAALVRQMYETYYDQNSDESITRESIKQTKNIYPGTADIGLWVDKYARDVLES